MKVEICENVQEDTKAVLRETLQGQMFILEKEKKSKINDLRKEGNNTDKSINQ